MKRIIALWLVSVTLIHASTPPVYKYRIYCVTEGQNVYEWAESTPTTCPNNTAHTINPNSISIIQQLASNAVKIQMEDVPTGGNFCAQTFSVTAAANTTTTSQASWPFNISILLVSWTTTSDNNGDIVNVEIPSHLTVGTITSNISVGDTTIAVSPTVLEYLENGYFVTITDGTHTDEVGRVIGISTTDNTITVETASTNAYSATTPTYVQMTIKPINNLEFGPAQTYTIGQYSLSATHIPANTPINVLYTNNGSDIKTLYFNYEYLY